MKRVYIGIALIGVMFLLCYQLHIPWNSITFWQLVHDQFHYWQQQHPWLVGVGYIVFFSIVLGVCVPIFDFSILLAGFLFGALGSGYALIVIILSTTLLYCIGSFLFGTEIKKMKEKKPKLAKAYDWIESYEEIGLLCLRLIPFIPFQWGTLLAAAIGMPCWKVLYYSILGYCGRLLLLTGAGVGIYSMIKNKTIQTGEEKLLIQWGIGLIVLGVVMAGVMLVRKRKKIKKNYKL